MRSHASIRPFAPPDLVPIVALWNRCLHKDPLSEERFWHLFLLDPNFDPQGALVAEIDGVPAGFLQAMVRRSPMGRMGLESDRGWITAFFVHPAHRREGIGRDLLEAGLRFLRRSSRSEVWCNGYAPCYVFPGVDQDYTEALAFLHAQGFVTAGDPVAMGMRLEGVRTSVEVHEHYAVLQREGFQVRLFQRDDALALIAFSEQYFPEYGDTVRDGLQRGNLEIVVAIQQNEIVGFTQWENTYTDPPYGAEGRFGPFGVRPDLRSRGVGSVIFYTLIERVSSRGVRYLWFGWAGGRNLTFYRRAGCVVTRQFHLLRKAL